MTLVVHLCSVLLQVETAETDTAPTVKALRESVAARLAVTAAAQIHMDLLDITTRHAAASTGLVLAVDCCSWSPPVLVVEHASRSQTSGEAVSAVAQPAAAMQKQVCSNCTRGHEIMLILRCD